VLFPLATIINTVQRFVEAGGYYVIFGLLFACGLGLPLPEDVPLIIGGYFVGTGHLNLGVLGVCAWLGIIGGDCVLYYMGCRYGLNITRLPLIGHHFTEKRIKGVEKLFEDYGVWVVAVCRLLAGVRGAMVVAAGIIRYNFVTFVIADGIAALISGGMWVGIGYWAGKKLGDLEHLRAKVQHYEHYVIGGIFLAVIGFILFKTSRRRQHKPDIADAALTKIVEKKHPEMSASGNGDVSEPRSRPSESLRSSASSSPDSDRRAEAETADSAAGLEDNRPE
jgi:membrane protein DedA with SNARE-associated domain